MKKLTVYLSSLCLAVSSIHFSSQALAEVETPTTNNSLSGEIGKATEFVVHGAKVHQFYSEIVDQQFEVRIQLPGGYQEGSETQYPLVVMLDGQWHFTSIGNALGSTNYDGQTPNSIVAAITWSGEGAIPDELRWRDFTHSPIPNQPLSGGASTFLQALETELLPFVENTYSGSGERVLVGSSLGGLFATWAMFEKPELFDSYVALSAPYVLEQEYFDSKLAELSGSKALKGKRLFIGVGSLEFNEPLVKGFSEQLKAAQLKGLKARTKVIHHVGHSGVNLAGFTYGLQHAFKRPRLSIDPELVERYSGNYIIHPSIPPIEISFEGKKLQLNQVGAPTLSLFAKSETEFYYEGADIGLEFIEPAEGTIIMVVKQYGQEFELLKEE